MGEISLFIFLLQPLYMMRTLRHNKRKTDTRKKMKNQKSHKTKIVGGFNYPMVSLQYDQYLVKCHTCSSTVYYEMDISVDRSKTAVIGMDILFGNNSNQFVSHPMKSYVCTQCNTCKLIYTSTVWNGLQQRIKPIKPQNEAIHNLAVVVPPPPPVQK